MNQEYMNQKSAEVVGVLQAISVVAKKLAQRLIKLEEEVENREESLSGKPASRKYL